MYVFHRSKTSLTDCKIIYKKNGLYKLFYMVMLLFYWSSYKVKLYAAIAIKLYILLNSFLRRLLISDNFCTSTFPCFIKF